MTPSHIIRTIVAQPAWALLLATVLAIGAAYSIYYGWLHPCAKFPGPLTCALSNAWKLFAVINEDMPDKLLELHDKYGPVVRIGPNDLSFNGADAVTAIYRRGWPKGDFYEAYQHHYPGLFDERDETLHAQRKRFVAPSLSVSAIHSMEGAMDRRYALLRGHLDRFAESGETFDLRNYIAFCISDVLGLLAFSEDFGSQEAEDLEKIPPVADALYRSALAGQVPWAADRIKKLLKSKRMLAGMRRIAPTAMKNIKLRAEGKLVRDDILGKIIVARERQESEPLHAKQLFTEATDLIVGGTDTTIQTICILFANLLRSPQHLSRVIAEADNSLPPLADGSAACALSGLEEKLDFVHAAVRESCRKNPVAAFNMPREVPVGGGEVAGYYVPSGVSSPHQIPDICSR